MAEELGLDEAASTFESKPEEEKEADEFLVVIFETVNRDAAE